MSKRLLALALTLVVAICFVACGPATIVGKWKDNILGVTITEFTQDGKVIIEVPSTTQKLEGTYKISNDTLTTQSGSTKRTYTFVIEGDQLKLTDKSGKVTTYTRQ